MSMARKIDRGGRLVTSRTRTRSTDRCRRSSSVGRTGVEPCNAPGSAGSTTRVESVAGTCSRFTNTCVTSASRGSSSTMRVICRKVIPAYLASLATTTTSADSIPSAYSP